MSSEAKEQEVVISWCKMQKGKCPELDLLFHIPNGGSRNFKEAMNLKKQGVKAGVMDLFLPVAKNGKHGLWIEMKYGKNKLTPKQNIWYFSMKEQGYEVEVCYSADEAIQVIKKYLGIR